MDPNRVEAAITPRTRAIMPVHLYGQPADMDPLRDIAQRHGLALIEDAAQAHGAEYNGRRAGSLGDMACFSFYPGKNLGAYGEAGMVVTDSDEHARTLRMLRDWGAEKKYEHLLKGYNYRMEGIQGAVLGVKLKHLNEWTARRRAIAHLYEELLADTPLQLPRDAAFAESVFHLYVVRHPKRDELKKHLEANQVGCALHYPVPLHVQKCYASLGYKAGDFPVSEKAARECLSLPIYPELTDKQVQRVVDVIREFFR
jgi:dTDP-4-amino-4,6-dideoxygalactose transaminase